MFRAALLLSLTTLVLGFSSGDLKVSVKAISSTVESIDDIILSVVVTNPTSEDIRVIGVNTVLDGGVTSSFAVSKDGEDLTFTGVRLTIDPTVEGVYKTIPAGKSVTVNHTNIASLYDFESYGTGTFTFAPNTIFQSSGSDVVKVSLDDVKVKVTTDVKKRELYPRELERRASTPSCNDGNRRNIIANTLADARALAGGAATDINSHPNSGRYNSYFGGNAQSDIWFNLDRIAGDLSSSGVRTIYCSSDTDPAALCADNSGVIAYTYLFTSGSTIVSSNIYLCNYFFTSTGSTAGTCSGGFDATQSSQGGVILHELAHAVFLANDVTYGCPACAALGTSDKKANADNYRCMGLAIHKDYAC